MSASIASTGVSGRISSWTMAACLCRRRRRSSLCRSGFAARPASEYVRRRMYFVSSSSSLYFAASVGVMGEPMKTSMVLLVFLLVIVGSITVRSRGWIRPAIWKSAGLRPAKNIGTIVAFVLSAMPAIVGDQAGSRTQPLRMSMLETSPDGKTPRMCPSRSHFIVSSRGLMFCFAALGEPKGLTGMNISRISGMSWSR